MSILYFFLDEAGDRIWTPTASKYFTLTSLMTDNVLPLAQDLHELKHSLIESDVNRNEIESFHAQVDPPFVRRRVYEVLGRFEHYRIDSVSVPKRVIYPEMRPDYKLYPLMCRLLFYWLLDRVDISTYERIIVCLSRFTLSSQREAFLAGIKKMLMPRLAQNQHLDIWFHQASAHPYLQVVDYFAWAIHRARERGDYSYRQSVSKQIKSNYLYYSRVTEKHY